MTDLVPAGAPVAEQPLPGLPVARADQYAVSILTADSSNKALREIEQQVATAIRVDGLSHLPTVHRVVDTSFLVVAHCPTALKRGDLLVCDQGTSRVNLLRDGVSRPYLDVSSWCNAHLWDTAVSADRRRLYVSMSGMRGPTANHVGIAGSSAVLEIDTESGRLTRAFTAFDLMSGVPYADRMLDLAGVVLTPDGQQILGCDFNDWQGNGRVVTIDINSGEVSVLTDGLDQPSTLSVDGPDHVLVANTRQPHGKAGGGQIVRVDIHTGQKEVLASIAGVDASLIGVVRLPDGSFIATMSEGTQEKCVLVRIDADGGRHRVIFHPQPGFLGSGVALDDESVWVAETLRRRVYQVDLDGAVRRHIQVYDDVDENDLQFMFRGFDTLESVKVVR